MGKRFEGNHPTAQDITNAFHRLGLRESIQVGRSTTAIDLTPSGNGDWIETICVPGRFNLSDFLDLMKDAGVTVDDLLTSKAV